MRCRGPGRREIDISPEREPAQRRHAWVRERHGDSGIGYAAIYDRLPPGTYTIWRNQWVIQRRVDHGRSLLESSKLPIDHVAREAGFASATLLRKHLRASVGLSPQMYRHTFRAPSSHAPA